MAGLSSKPQSLFESRRDSLLVLRLGLHAGEHVLELVLPSAHLGASSLLLLLFVPLPHSVELACELVVARSRVRSCAPFQAHVLLWLAHSLRVGRSGLPAHTGGLGDAIHISGVLPRSCRIEPSLTMARVPDPPQHAIRVRPWQVPEAPELGRLVTSQNVTAHLPRLVLDEVAIDLVLTRLISVRAGFDVEGPLTNGPADLVIRGTVVVAQVVQVMGVAQGVWGEVLDTLLPLLIPRHRCT
mmetsp:Transcript_69924/g.181384  ORF Transcript_69924/g.181384 Transcript_69924/m.181384 type:complete len:241 (+) Transcript_69924:49-771(+)